MVAHHARLEGDEDRFAPYKVIGELGSRPLPVYVARHATAGSAGAPVVVVERFLGAGDEAGADFRREARRLSTLANQHILRVREVVVRGQDLLVFGDFIEGEKLGSLWRFDGEAPATSGARAKPGERLPLEITLRWLLDVLTGLSALHALRDARQQPMKLMHGEISPATILVGLDGVGRILHAVARRAPDVRAEAASFDYLAPEIHANASRDGRADVFSVGVLLWEALAGTRLSASCDGPAGLQGQHRADRGAADYGGRAVGPGAGAGRGEGAGIRPRGSLADRRRHGCRDPQGGGPEARTRVGRNGVCEEQVRRPSEGAASAPGEPWRLGARACRPRPSPPLRRSRPRFWAP